MGWNDRAGLVTEAQYDAYVAGVAARADRLRKEGGPSSSGLCTVCKGDEATPDTDLCPACTEDAAPFGSTPMGGQAGPTVFDGGTA